MQLRITVAEQVFSKTYIAHIKVNPSFVQHKSHIWLSPKTMLNCYVAFFPGKLLDLLESFSWDYLVKVKLKNLEDLLKAQDWTDVKGVRDVAICEFSYRAKSWQRSRVLKAMCSVKEYVEVSY